MSGVVPAKIAAAFTPGELAVLSVIGRQCQRGGTCSLPIDAIAALAGVSRTSVQNALRQARRLGLLEVKERRRRGLRSLTNIVRVISKDWTAWLKLGGSGAMRAWRACSGRRAELHAPRRRARFVRRSQIAIEGG